MFSTSSLEMTCPLSLESLSSSAAAPVTVTVSAAAPTCMFKSTRCRAFTATLNVSVSSGAKPAASARAR